MNHDRTFDGARMNLSRDVDENELAALNVKFLRDRHPTHTRDSVASDTGIPSATVKRWLEEYSPPNWRSVCLLTQAYGNEWLRYVFGGLTIQTIEDKRYELERQKAALARDEAELDRREALARSRRATNARLDRGCTPVASEAPSEPPRKSA